jgi:dinuclear metal center YbgI/SA1388 family protein
MEISLDKTSASRTTVGAVARAIEKWAPPALAESYDNPGLQVGRADHAVSRALIALDMTPQVLDEAIDLGCELIVTHHPLVFSPLKSLTNESYVSNLALRLAESGIALYSAHTNLDSARGGVSFALAEQLGLINVDFLMHKADAVVKLVTFLPEGSADAVRTALADAGCGQIGQYTECLFESSGTGHFKPGAGTDPAVGDAAGPAEKVDEIRLETEVARWLLPGVLAVLRDVHPYEEVPYDIYPVQQPFRNAGLGAVGELEKPISLRTFLEVVSNVLENPALRYAGDPDQMITRVAVCGGSGSKFLSAAKRAGADVFITADVTYHTFFDVLNVDGNPAIALIDPGHYESERITEELMVNFLTREVPDVEWNRTATRTAPVKTFLQ